MIHIGVGFPRLKLVSGLQKDNVEQKDNILARVLHSQLMGTGFIPPCLQPTPIEPLSKIPRFPIWIQCTFCIR